MPLLARPLSLRRIALAWMVAAQIVLTSSVFALRTLAQQEPNAPAQPAGPLLQNPLPSNQVAFMNAYAGRPVRDLEKDKAFGHLVKEVIPKTTYHYGRDMPLTEAMDDALDGSKLPVLLRDGRYLTVNGERGP